MLIATTFGRSGRGKVVRWMSDMCSIKLSGFEVRNSQNCLEYLMRTAQIDGVVGRRVSSRDFLFSMVLFDCCRWTDSGSYVLVYI